MCSHDDCRVEVLPDGQIVEEHTLSYEELVSFWERVGEIGCQITLPKYQVATPQGIVTLGLAEFVELAARSFALPQKFVLGGSDGKSGTNP